MNEDVNVTAAPQGGSPALRAQEERCFWCNTLPSEAAAQHEGPHSTWCPHFREHQRGGLDEPRGLSAVLDPHHPKIVEHPDDKQG
jgi:hypothetical protein